MTEEKKKECVVFYKKATHKNLPGHCYGTSFDKLIACCEDFNTWFGNTGNHKGTNWNNPGEHQNDKPGINFGMLRGEDVVYLSVSISGKISFCPFCGTKIEVAQSKSVVLRPVNKEVFDHFEEVSV
ncbi:MAG: hypothetical protein Q8Q06_02860 [bacterium]|nr:hypothetical protein [bacterium]